MYPSIRAARQTVPKEEESRNLISTFTFHLNPVCNQNSFHLHQYLYSGWRIFSSISSRSPTHPKWIGSMGLIAGDEIFQWQLLTWRQSNIQCKTRRWKLKWCFSVLCKLISSGNEIMDSVIKVKFAQKMLWTSLCPLKLRNEIPDRRPLSDLRT